MQALVYTAEQQLHMREQPAPRAAAGEVVVAIDAVGVCGSDMHAWLGHDARRVPPLVLGHEAAGRVVSGKRAGMRVVLNPLISCGDCAFCLAGRHNLCRQRDLIGMYRPGAFAEQIAIPERNLIEIPNGMPSNIAALTEPAATALHAIVLAEKSNTRAISECKTLVLGAGSVGLLSALILGDKGAITVDLAETNPRRRERVQQCTDCAVFDPVATPPPADTYDLIIDAVGNAVTRAMSVECVQPGGCIAHIGLLSSDGGLDVRRMTLQEITFIGSYTYTPIDLRVVLQKMHTQALGKLNWFDTRNLTDGPTVFTEIHAGECAAPKVILSPSS